MEPGDHMMKGLQIQKESRKIHADIVERKNRTNILIRRGQLMKQEDFENECMFYLVYILLCIHVFYKKTIFCLSLNFLNIILEIRLRFS